MTPRAIRSDSPPRRRLAAAALAAAFLAVPATPGCAMATQSGAADGASAARRSGDASRPRHPRDLKFEPLTYELRRTERVVLSNGMVVHLMEDHSLPLVSGSAQFRGGAVFDPPGKEGLASLACSMVRTGGTTSVPAADLDERLDEIAGSVSVGAGTESASASFSFLARDTAAGLALFADVLRNPTFDAQRFAQVKMQSLQGLQQQMQSPGGVLGRTFPGVVYGGHPYGRVPTQASLSAIKAADLAAYHAKWFHPETFVLSVAGDFRRDEMLATLERVFAGWAASPEELPRDPEEFAREYRGGHHVVALPGTDQTNLSMGHWGPKQVSRDRVVCDVMNLILGGGSFWSRMTKVVRTKEGLAYSVGSRFSRGSVGGLFTANTQTKAESTYRAIALMVDLIREIRDQPVTQEDLDQAKNAVLNSFVRVIESPASLAAQYADLEFKGYPADWLDQYRDIVRSVTIEDVQRVAQEYLRPDHLEFVVVGDPSRFDAPPAWLPKARTLPVQ